LKKMRTVHVRMAFQSVLHLRNVQTKQILMDYQDEVL